MSENKIISIPLRQGSNSKSINMAAVTAAVSQEYAVRYLESLGASPTRDKIELVNAQMNIKDALVLPNWTSVSVDIVPGRGHESAVQQQMRELREATEREMRFLRENGELTMKKKEKERKKPNPLAEEVFNMRRKKKVVRKKVLQNVTWVDLINNLKALGPVELSSSKFKALMDPITYDAEDTGLALQTYFESMTSFISQLSGVGGVSELHLQLITFLRDPQCAEIYGLLLNYTYWNIIHPVARTVLMEVLHMRFDTSELHQSRIRQRSSLFQSIPDDNTTVTTESASSYDDNTSYDNTRTSVGQMPSLQSSTSLEGSEKEKMYLKLEYCIDNLFKEHVFKAVDVSVARRALVTSCHFVVNEIIKDKYKWFNSITNDKQRARKGEAVLQQLELCKLQFLHAINESLSDLLDPLRLYGTTLIRNDLVDQIFPFGGCSGSKGRFYITSAPLRAVFNNHASPETRKFLSSNDSKPLIPIPGVSTADLRQVSIQRGIFPEMNDQSTSGPNPFLMRRSSQIANAQITSKKETTISAGAKNQLLHLVVQQQKKKYRNNEIAAASRCYDASERLDLLDSPVRSGSTPAAGKLHATGSASSRSISPMAQYNRSAPSTRTATPQGANYKPEATISTVSIL